MPDKEIRTNKSGSTILQFIFKLSEIKGTHPFVEELRKERKARLKLNRIFDKLLQPDIKKEVKSKKALVSEDLFHTNIDKSDRLGTRLVV